MNRHHQLVESIRSLALKEGLVAGQRLPSERALAERFGASRGGVREAIRSLAEQGVVVSRHGDGTYLVDREKLIEGPASALAAQHARVRHVFDFRRMLEPAIARMAAEHFTARDLERLKVLTLDQQRALADMDDPLEQKKLLRRAAALDEDFHMQLARATGNPVVVEVLRTASGLIGESRCGALQTEERRQDSLTGHLELISALEQRDPDKAERAMRMHLAVAERDALAGEPRTTPSHSTTH